MKFNLKKELLRSEQQSSNKGQLLLKRGELASGNYLLRAQVNGESIKLPFVVE